MNLRLRVESLQHCRRSRSSVTRFVATSLGIALFASGFLSHAQNHPEDLPLLPVVDSSYSAKIVARVGPVTITAQQFLLSYEFGPAFVKRTRDSKLKYLGYMINEKLFALDAEGRGLKRVPPVVRSIKEIEGDLATEELYREDVLDKVHVSDSEVSDAMAGERIHESLRWIYSPTRGGIDSAQAELKRGIPFDSLFQRQLVDFVKPDSRSWETTRYQLQNLRPAIATIADSLKQGVASVPVEGPDGWYIVSLDNITYDAIATESELIKARYDVTRSLRQHKADSLSDRYINGIMSAHHPEINRKTFEMLSAYLATIWVPAKQRAAWDLGRSLGHEAVNAATANIDRFGKEPLVMLNDRSVHLSNFLSWYRARDTILKLKTTSPLAFQLSLEGLVWRMVRDGLLIDRATKRGLNERPTVRTQKTWWEEKILYAEEKQELEDSVKPSDASVRKYFETHRKDYRSPGGDTLGFDEAREQVGKDCASMELTKRILRRLIALKRKYPIEIFDKVLNSLPVDNENDPKAIDVYVAKTSGTFPHPAFPTIDIDWQTWE